MFTPGSVRSFSASPASSRTTVPLASAIVSFTDLGFALRE